MGYSREMDNFQMQHENEEKVIFAVPGTDAPDDYNVPAVTPGHGMSKSLICCPIRWTNKNKTSQRMDNKRKSIAKKRKKRAHTNHFDGVAFFQFHHSPRPNDDGTKHENIIRVGMFINFSLNVL